MAQATRFDDFSAAGVLAVYRALQTLPVPDGVLSHGLNATAARVNLATTIDGGFMPNFARLGEMCRKQDNIDEALVADCLAVAHLFGPAARTVRNPSVSASRTACCRPAPPAMYCARACAQRLAAAAVSRNQRTFCARRALSQTYVDLLRENSNELATVTALLRNQHLSTEPPAGWQPQQANPNAVARDPNVIPPAH
jgi:hypothetical protein